MDEEGVDANYEGNEADPGEEAGPPLRILMRTWSFHHAFGAPNLITTQTFVVVLRLTACVIHTLTVRSYLSDHGISF